MANTKASNLQPISNAEADDSELKIIKELAKARIDLIQGYAAILEKAAQGEHISANDYNAVDNKYNVVIRSIDNVLKGMPDEKVERISDKANDILNEWTEENIDTMGDLKRSGFIVHGAFSKGNFNNAPPKQLNISPDTKSRDELFVELLKNNKGLAIAENHMRSPSEAYIVDGIKAAQKAGIKVGAIATEMRASTFSKLDSMSISELQAEIEKRTSESIKEQAKEKYGEGTKGYYDDLKINEKKTIRLRMFLFAKENDIKVVNIDKEGPAREVEFALFQEHHRVVSTNFTWTDNIKKVIESLPPDSKIVVYGGYAHFAPINGNGNPGISNALGFPVIAFDDRETSVKDPILKGKSPHGVDFYLPGGTCHPDDKKMAEISDTYEKKGLSIKEMDRAISDIKDQYYGKLSYTSCDHNNNLAPGYTPPISKGLNGNIENSKNR